MNVPAVLVWAPIAVVTAIAMDLWAALLHGRVWHRWLWFVHRSHHEQRRGAFERNDALSILHAPPAIALILYGCAGPPGPLREILFGVGLGASIFGLAYVVVHDGLVHGRLPVRWLGRFGYLRDVVRAHRVHHAAPEGGPPFGLFFGPLELRRHRVLMRSRGASRERGRGPSGPPSTDRGPAGPHPTRAGDVPP